MGVSGQRSRTCLRFEDMLQTAIKQSAQDPQAVLNIPAAYAAECISLQNKHNTNLGTQHSPPALNKKEAQDANLCKV